MHWCERRVMLIGAGSQAGMALAEALIARRARLLLVDRDEWALRQLANQAPDHVDWLVADTRNAVGRTRITAAAQTVGIDMLINTTQVGHQAAFAFQPPAQLSDTLETHVTATLLVTQALLPVLHSADEAWVVNLCATLDSADGVAHRATRTALRGFSQALRHELTDTAIHIHHVAPLPRHAPLVAPADRQAARKVAVRVLQAVERPSHARLWSLIERVVMNRDVLSLPGPLERFRRRSRQAPPPTSQRP